ncbi:RagB/SusD family nutrient uptake outer membrane protein [Parapedobacter tibetensis]|uniref:RagB/SusD family nutrient uptake outer membrane protein n=1 Tax=Parapedobacter tibetensis TaxID=2972951 RepID=UPI00214DC073|nr:RagB/SusD family nutrient uptake outer membrane protein [Parapedobacter tibetensis]
MKKINIYIVLFIGIVSLNSCSSFLDVPPPKDQLAAEVAFADDQVATATVLGMYSQMNAYNNQFANGLLSFLTAMSADEFYYAFNFYDDFKDNNLSPNTSFLDRFWSQPYAYINHANKIIEGLQASNGVTENVKNQLLGEAHFIRAFCYFYLVNLFDGVPIVVDTDYQKNTLLPRSPSDEVNQFIIDELVLAEQLLDDAYTGQERVRPNKKAASTMLARAYLYQEQWVEAEAEATKVIQDSRYIILDSLHHVFLIDSKEAIWQLQTANTSTVGVNTWEGFNIVPFNPGTRSNYNVYEEALDSYEAGDQRKEDCLTTYELNAETFYYPYKYKRRTASPVVEYSMVLRFAEVYLIRAEARAQQNDLGNAIADLNVLRRRADVEELPLNLDQASVLAAVEQERRIELLGEWGHRWFDLKRTGRAVDVLSPIKTGFTASDLLFPIPLAAILTNPNLTQND